MSNINYVKQNDWSILRPKLEVKELKEQKRALSQIRTRAGRFEGKD